VGTPLLRASALTLFTVAAVWQRHGCSGGQGVRQRTQSLFRMHSIKGLYLEAIRSNRSNGLAYYHLGAALGAAEVVTLLDGSKLRAAAVPRSAHHLVRKRASKSDVSIAVRRVVADALQEQLAGGYHATVGKGDGLTFFEGDA
jgi:hypothetical protein